MTRTAQTATATQPTSRRLRSSRVKAEPDSNKQEPVSPEGFSGKRAAVPADPRHALARKRARLEPKPDRDDSDSDSDSDTIKHIKPGPNDNAPSTPARKYPDSSPKKSKGRPADLQARKLKLYTGQSPFPDFPHPTPEECKLAHRVLSRLHGSRKRPSKVVASATRAGCGDSPSVLDALVRTILSQNTSDANSSRAKRSMDSVYGRSDKWEAIVEGGRARLQEAIKCGGLSAVKSRVIINILQQVCERHGEYSLEHLHKVSSEEAMREMLSFQGVGPKTASCVLLFCLGRESFAVDTHVWRITGLLGWRPAKASRDETHLHLDARIPDELKYGLHVLLVGHGKKCDECKAGGKNNGKCELRKAFRKGKLAGGVGEDGVKEEGVKEEEDTDDDVKREHEAEGEEGMEKDSVKEEEEHEEDDEVEGVNEMADEVIKQEEQTEQEEVDTDKEIKEP